MSCDWEGNRRSGVAQAMRHRLGSSTYGLKAQVTEMSTPPTLLIGYGTLYLYLMPRLRVCLCVTLVYGANRLNGLCSLFLVCVTTEDSYFVVLDGVRIRH